jgi:hypothetical protein
MRTVSNLRLGGGGGKFLPAIMLAFSMARCCLADIPKSSI